MVGEVIACFDAAFPFVGVLIQTHLVGFRRVNTFEANLNVTDGECVAIDDARDARNHISGRRVGRKRRHQYER